ncbi:hypothetical protein [Capnocytophaga sputigena]|uniref:hypothetical protein n=1 Tax=Capnocytophaga sputigena TaxID=1019 RepID=UPI00288B23C4|nr:hypothetical protein [Capnocytophaga sputigena]
MAEITERLADSEEKEELLALKEKAIDLLKENNFACDESNPKEVATSLRHFIDAYKEQKVTADTLAYDKVDLAYGLGELFANAVMNFYQWEYFYLDKGNDVAGFAVVNPNKKWYIFVHHYLYDLLFDEEKENNLLLNFNTLNPSELKPYEKPHINYMGLN